MSEETYLTRDYNRVQSHLDALATISFEYRVPGLLLIACYHAQTATNTHVTPRVSA